MNYEKVGKSNREWLIKKLKSSEAFQQEYLKASVEENYDMPEAILIALRDIAEVRGYERLANESGLSKKSLYKILGEDKKAKPRFETIAQIIHALGLQITVKKISKKNAG